MIVLHPQFNNNALGYKKSLAKTTKYDVLEKWVQLMWEQPNAMILPLVPEGHNCLTKQSFSSYINDSASPLASSCTMIKWGSCSSSILAIVFWVMIVKRATWALSRVKWMILVVQTGCPRLVQKISVKIPLATETGVLIARRMVLAVFWYTSYRYKLDSTSL